MRPRFALAALAAAAVGVAGAGAAEPAPRNPFLAASASPTFHHDPAATGSTPLPGPVAGEALELQVIRTRANGPSCWSLVGEPYAGGAVPVWGATVTHVTKVLVDGPRFELVDKHRIDREMDLHWNCVLLRGNRLAVLDPNQRRVMLFGDRRPGEAESPIAELARFVLPAAVPGKPQTLTAAYDGHLLVLTDAGHLVALRVEGLGSPAPALALAASLDLASVDGDIACHNSQPVDPDGGVYLVSDLAMTKVRWTGKRFEPVWHAAYDTRGPKAPRRVRPGLELLRVLAGAEGTGSGTTPTLLEDVVVIVDGRTPNRLVAFWRGEIPPGWEPRVAGGEALDPRVAGVLELPFATPAGRGFSTENSPAAWGDAVAVAQWNGIFPVDDPLPGVQRARWDADAAELRLDWSRGDVNLNNVLTVSTATGLLYGQGVEAGRSVYRALDWTTGETAWAFDLGDAGDAAFDGGNQQSILPDRSLVWGCKAGIARLRVVESEAATPR
ncbi:hypothetical protein [Phycisphaera mikurensis]|uniref:Uncharacterized protein n=1 Tax=Phycisphaera mikurensis (strain NBRC 102666 / KCTC 22515 / FYK2301M01) TaxID=1142394 RepID=I0IFV9_PHYMF|nr:hypothetical protein [Phycisphaera mikurensis]MBB6440464.1 hypothetical protein [Phycisphaera mikurensis]BAM04147.1 hypothetical protein PSMK_19880 [Phycisphaera mikurensis NBRC 102666]